MTGRLRQDVGTDHRVEISRDSRTGNVYVRVRRHKRGKPVSFTVEQWQAFWVPDIPLPLYRTVGRLGIRQCQCGQNYWTDAGYRGHYALRHVLKLGER